MGLTDNSPVASGWRDTLLSVATAVIAVTAIVGVYLLIDELKELQRQNNALEITMRQAYRPLGVVNYSTDLEFRSVIIGYVADAKPGKFSFVCEPLLFNRGKGVLSFLGSLLYLSKEEIDFRRDFLSGRLDTVMFDHTPTYARRSPIQPDNYLELTCGPLLNLDFEKRYFLYSLFLYEDQEGFLYDTERIDILNFEEEPTVTEHGLIPKVTEGYSAERYHYYSIADKQDLLHVIDSFDHPLGNVIRAGH